jgi:hypothetical protein
VVRVGASVAERGRPWGMETVDQRLLGREGTVGGVESGAVRMVRGDASFRMREGAQALYVASCMLRAVRMSASVARATDNLLPRTLRGVWRMSQGRWGRWGRQGICWSDKNECTVARARTTC